MRLRFPRPLEGWRNFAGEVGTIVLGVVIALAAGQAVDRWQWQQQVEKANDVFDDELTLAAVMAYQRLAVHRCDGLRLREIAQRLGDSGSKWRGMPDKSDTNDFYSNIGAVTYRAPGSWFPTAGWNSALDDGTLNHVPIERRQALAGAYTWIQQFKADGDLEAATQTKLDVLARDGTLTLESKIALTQDVSELDRLETALWLDAGNVLVWVRKVQPNFWPHEAQRKIREVVDLQRGRGSCVETPTI